ncbi:voltage-dependent calcium channel subunit alpha-2 delta-3 [Labeo rohita]|uniref:Voltage-dependent calcium channel subunit alpha-2 delta-3 n=1 Tax=Labeo rohita TaxID=84645 RepID=A0A498M4B7_LABRO|nr:voltage-dependent calcium channel subunit alpha-2 delta-3 [Labeo rohita]
MNIGPSAQISAVNSPQVLQKEQVSSQRGQNGIKWTPDEHGVLEFDCRNRKWYIQAATSPKDVVILVDVSGSMKGLRLTIARQTVSSILDTLGDDDFFNIIAYNEELHYVEPCLNGTLVQADIANKDVEKVADGPGQREQERKSRLRTRRGRETNDQSPKGQNKAQNQRQMGHFRDRLDKLFAKGIGMLDVALTEAFELLSNFNETGRGSVCSQAIMLVTDGAVETYDTVFAKYNWPDRKFHMIQTESETDSNHFVNLPDIEKELSDESGYFTQISTLADVQENVMEYLHVLSRPKVIDREHDMVWTEAYVDSTLEDAQGPVLMTTVAMPVFSTKNETVSDAKF